MYINTRRIKKNKKTTKKGRREGGSVHVYDIATATIERDSVMSTCALGALYLHFVRVVDSVQGFLFHEAVQVVDRLSQQNITTVVARPILVHPPLKLFD